MKTLFTAVAFILAIAAAGSGVAQPQGFDARKTIIVLPVKDGLDVQAVQGAILSKAAEVNMKFVGHQPLSEELRSRGIDSPALHIYQFCNPADARRMVDFDMVFAAYMPCRIVLVERDGKLFLTMMNLDMFLQSLDLPSELQEVAHRVNDTLKAIIEAGASGDF